MQARLLRRRRWRLLLALGVVVLAIVALMIAALGSELLWHALDEISELILYRIRLPRALSALLAGAALGLSGTLM